MQALNKNPQGLRTRKLHEVANYTRAVSSSRSAGRLQLQRLQTQQQPQPLLRRRAPQLASSSGEDAPMSVSQVAELISMQPLDDEQRTSVERLSEALGVDTPTAKQMAFKRRGLLLLEPQELHSRLATIAEVVGVPEATARRMAAIQPGLLFDTQRQAEALALGIKVIGYELNAPKDEVVDLIINNQSVLHGREMHLSVADIAHLAMLRQPVGRIAE